MDTNESIGYGATVHIDDGASSAYVAVDNLVDFDPPDETLGVAESKRLSLPGGVIIKVPTILSAGKAMLKQQFTQAGFARMEGLKRNKTKQNFKFTVPDDTSTTVVIVAGYVVSNKRDTVQPDQIQEFSTEVELTGAQSAS